MARVLTLLIAAALGLLFIAMVLRPLQRPGSDRLFRPRASRGPSRRPGAEAAAAGQPVNWVVRRAELQGVRDAYSSASVDPDAPLWCCTHCQAVYHASSRAALAAQNGGHCALCGGGDLRPLQVV